MTTYARHSDVFQGRWVRRGLIHVPTVDDAPAIEPTNDEPAVDWGAYTTPASIADAIDEHDWTDDDIRRSHAAYIRGERDPWTIAGHRIWDREYRARKRAEKRMSPVDMAWAEKAADAGFWAAWERANRCGGASEPMVAQAIRRTEKLHSVKGAA